MKAEQKIGCGLLTAQLLFLAALAICWVTNLVQLLNCDFSPIDKNEIVHAIGLIPFVSLFTVWL